MAAVDALAAAGLVAAARRRACIAARSWSRYASTAAFALAMRVSTSPAVTAAASARCSVSLAAASSAAMRREWSPLSPPAAPGDPPPVGSRANALSLSSGTTAPGLTPAE